VIIVQRGCVRWNYEVKIFTVNFALVPFSRLLYKDLKLHFICCLVSVFGEILINTRCNNNVSLCTFSAF